MVGVSRLTAVPPLAQYPLHLPPDAEAVVIALLLSRRRSPYCLVQCTFETVFLNEVLGDYMGIVAQVGLLCGDSLGQLEQAPTHRRVADAVISAHEFKCLAFEQEITRRPRAGSLIEIVEEE